MIKGNKGITLIALVITIIVLLILAGITISLTIGNQGVITRAQQASKNYKDAETKEQEELNNFDGEVENVLNDVFDEEVKEFSYYYISHVRLDGGRETFEACLIPEKVEELYPGTVAVRCNNNEFWEDWMGEDLCIPFGRPGTVEFELIDASENVLAELKITLPEGYLFEGYGGSVVSDWGNLTDEGWLNTVDLRNVNASITLGEIIGPEDWELTSSFFGYTLRINFVGENYTRNKDGYVYVTISCDDFKTSGWMPISSYPIDV